MKPIRRFTRRAGVLTAATTLLLALAGSTNGGGAWATEPRVLSPRDDMSWMGWWTQVTHPTRAVIGIPSDVLFATDSADLESSAVGVLTQAATSINSTSGTVHILGYTDSQGSPNYNLMLSVERAQSVADEFIILGVSRMRLEVSGMGDANPVASNATASGRAENRRVDIELPQ